MNILFSCAGRRNYLIRFFREALNGSGQVVAADKCLQAPAMAEADVAELVPEVYSEDFMDRLMEICCKHDIKVVIPLNDLDLPMLSAAKSRFLAQGIVPIVSEPSVIDTCFDKWKTVQFLHGIGLRTPKTFMSLDTALDAVETGELRFPLVVKPRWGSGSIGVEFVDDQYELELAYPLTFSKIKRSILYRASQADMEHAVLIQEKINGTEFGMDVVNDLNGCYVATITKQKLAMRAGETDKAVTVSNAELKNIGQTIGTSLQHIANLDCDVFEKDGRFYVLELNPRFGGGYPFSQMAGVNLPAAILCWLQNRTPDSRYFHFEVGRAFSKCDTLIEIQQ